MPTAYLGLSELGEIAGIGMVIAFFASITLLPALLTVLNPGGEPNPLGLVVLAPVDRFMERHRVPIVAITILAVTLASPLLLYLPFDFNPLHLQNPKVELVATYLELRNDPQTGANAIEIEANDLAGADAMAHRIGALPQVSQTMTLSSLVPQDQDEKIKLIHAAAAKIDASLNPEKVEEPPTDQDNIGDLSGTSEVVEERGKRRYGRCGCGAAAGRTVIEACRSGAVGASAGTICDCRTAETVPQPIASGASAPTSQHRHASIGNCKGMGRSGWSLPHRGFA